MASSHGGDDASAVLKLLESHDLAGRAAATAAALHKRGEPLKDAVHDADLVTSALGRLDRECGVSTSATPVSSLPGTPASTPRNNAAHHPTPPSTNGAALTAAEPPPAQASDASLFANLTTHPLAFPPTEVLHNAIRTTLTSPHAPLADHSTTATTDAAPPSHGLPVSSSHNDNGWLAEDAEQLATLATHVMEGEARGLLPAQVAEGLAGGDTAAASGDLPPAAAPFARYAGKRRHDHSHHRHHRSHQATATLDSPPSSSLASRPRTPTPSPAVGASPPRCAPMRDAETGARLTATISSPLPAVMPSSGTSQSTTPGATARACPHPTMPGSAGGGGSGVRGGSRTPVRYRGGLDSASSGEWPLTGSGAGRAGSAAGAPSPSGGGGSSAPPSLIGGLSGAGSVGGVRRPPTPIPSRVSGGATSSAASSSVASRRGSYTSLADLDELAAVLEIEEGLGSGATSSSTRATTPTPVTTSRGASTSDTSGGMDAHSGSASSRGSSSSSTPAWFSLEEETGSAEQDAGMAELEGPLLHGGVADLTATTLTTTDKPAAVPQKPPAGAFDEPLGPPTGPGAVHAATNSPPLTAETLAALAVRLQSQESDGTAGGAKDAAGVGEGGDAEDEGVAGLLEGWGSLSGGAVLDRQMTPPGAPRPPPSPPASPVAQDTGRSLADDDAAAIAVPATDNATSAGMGAVRSGEEGTAVHVSADTVGQVGDDVPSSAPVPPASHAAPPHHHVAHQPHAHTSHHHPHQGGPLHSHTGGPLGSLGHDGAAWGGEGAALGGMQRTGVPAVDAQTDLLTSLQEQMQLHAYVGRAAALAGALTMTNHTTPERAASLAEAALDPARMADSGSNAAVVPPAAAGVRHPPAVALHSQEASTVASAPRIPHRPPPPPPSLAGPGTVGSGLEGITVDNAAPGGSLAPVAPPPAAEACATQDASADSVMPPPVAAPLPDLPPHLGSLLGDAELG